MSNNKRFGIFLHMQFNSNLQTFSSINFDESLRFPPAEYVFFFTENQPVLNTAVNISQVLYGAYADTIRSGFGADMQK
jgi:hypothetical protein